MDTKEDLAALRQRKGFRTAVALGWAVAARGVDPSTIAKIEQGRSRDPRMSTLKALAKVLKEPVAKVITAIENIEAA